MAKNMRKEAQAWRTNRWVCSLFAVLGAAGCWSQGGDGQHGRADGGPPVATRVDASVALPDAGAAAPTDAGSGGGGVDGGGGGSGGDDAGGGGGSGGDDAGGGCGSGCEGGDGGGSGSDDAGGGHTASDAGKSPVDAGGGGGGDGGTFMCGDIVGCASHCNNVASCRMQCRSYATAAEQTKYDTLYYCITVHGCTDVACSFAFCNNEITTCRVNGKSCSAVLQCADTCPDDACENACIATGTPYAQQLIDMIRQCGLQHGCSNASCLWASCRPQVNACLAI